MASSTEERRGEQAVFMWPLKSIEVFLERTIVSTAVMSLPAFLSYCVTALAFGISRERISVYPPYKSCSELSIELPMALLCTCLELLRALIGYRELFRALHRAVHGSSVPHCFCNLLSELLKAHDF